MNSFLQLISRVVSGWLLSVLVAKLGNQNFKWQKKNLANMRKKWEIRVMNQCCSMLQSLITKYICITHRKSYHFWAEIATRMVTFSLGIVQM